MRCRHFGTQFVRMRIHVLSGKFHSLVRAFHTNFTMMAHAEVSKAMLRMSMLAASFRSPEFGPIFCGQMKFWFILRGRNMDGSVGPFFLHPARFFVRRRPQIGGGVQAFLVLLLRVGRLRKFLNDLIFNFGVAGCFLPMTYCFVTLLDMDTFSGCGLQWEYCKHRIKMISMCENPRCPQRYVFGNFGLFLALGVIVG